jgi:hypothetical protein
MEFGRRLECCEPTVIIIVMEFPESSCIGFGAGVGIGIIQRSTVLYGFRTHIPCCLWRIPRLLSCPFFYHVAQTPFWFPLVYKISFFFLGLQERLVSGETYLPSQIIYHHKLFIPYIIYIIRSLSLILSFFILFFPRCLMPRIFPSFTPNILEKAF